MKDTADGTKCDSDSGGVYRLREGFSTLEGTVEPLYKGHSELRTFL